MRSTTLTHGLSEKGTLVERHWQEMANKRRTYTAFGMIIFLIALGSSLWFANDSNSGKFFDRLPYIFDFVEQMIPRDPFEIFRAMFDLASPYDNGSLMFNYPEGRQYITDTFYIPEYFYRIAETINIAIVSTFFGFFFGIVFAFLAAKNMMPNRFFRGFIRRILEILRAFPEVVLAGFFLAILSLGPIPAIIAVSIHTVGSLGKMFYEVIENADMKPEEGLRAVGANWIERVCFGMVPQVMPNFTSYLLLRLEINVRASTIIGAVGGGGIGELLRLSIGQSHPAKTLAIIILLFITIVSVDQLSAWLRKKLVGDQSFQMVQ